MEFVTGQVLSILKDKSVENLYHANTVVTSCHFLRKSALLSRGTIERLGLYQTPQSSDEIDKKEGIWFDIFVDTDDIHSRASRNNEYGPVMFVMDSSIVEGTDACRIWVTKLNPTKWSGKSEDEIWFKDKTDLQANLVKGRFDQMILFRHCGGEIPFKNFLKKIVIDDPSQKTSDGADLFSMAVGAIRLASLDSGLMIPIERRHCSSSCNCKSYYNRDIQRTLTMFDPRKSLL